MIFSQQFQSVQCALVFIEKQQETTPYLYLESGGAMLYSLEYSSLKNICEFLKTKFSSTLKDIPTSYINYDILPSLPTGPMSSNIFKKHVAFLNS